MIQFDDGLIASRCAPLPPDWLAMDFVRVANDAKAPTATTARALLGAGLMPCSSRTTAPGCTTPSSAHQLYFGGTPNLTDSTVYKIVY